MPKPPTYFRPTDIPDELFHDLAATCGEPFATSYLSGATARGKILMPWTETAWMVLSRDYRVRAVLQRAGLKLDAPIPFGHPSHPASLLNIDRAA